MSEDPFDILSLFEDNPTEASEPETISKEETVVKHPRKNQRFLVHWKIGVVFDHAVQGRERFYGQTDDISMSGVSLYSEHNIFVESPVTVLISIPGYQINGRNKLVEIRCKMVYTYLSSTGKGFRTGLNFSRFKDKGKKILQEALDARIPAGDTNARD